MERERAFAAIIDDGKILMVKVEEKDRSYWTLPGGGGVNAGETKEEAAMRETHEEANIEIGIIRFLFQRQYSAGTEYCYLAIPRSDADIELGYDPELGRDEQILTEVAWKDIYEARHDLHVSQMLKSLSRSELVRFKIRTKEVL